MATALTKNIKYTPSDYQQWGPGDYVVGDILGIRESLGKSARRITLESPDAETSIRFNVCRYIYKNQEAVGNTFIPDAAFWGSPALVAEIEIETPLIVIEKGSVQTWDSEFPIDDIKIISAAALLRITVR